MNSLRLIDLIHSDPLAEYSEKDFVVTRGNTRDNLIHVMNGSVDYAMISLVDYFKNTDKLKIVDGPTISGKIHSNSNLLISKGDDPYAGMYVAVSSETETTAFFLKLLLDKLYPDSKLLRSKKGDADDLLKEQNFALVIGNNALDIYKTNLRILLDVTHMMSRIFNRYSIYSVTVSLKNTENDPNLNRVKQVPSWFINKHIKKISSERKISEMLLRTYYSALTYDFNEIILENITEYEKDYAKIREHIFQ